MAVKLVPEIDDVADCPLCGSRPVIGPAYGILVAGISCSNHDCILALHNQDELNHHLTLADWPKKTNPPPQP